MIVEYKFHRIKGGKGRVFVPSFIIDGGYFKEGNKYVGIAANDGTYIPSTLVVMDRASLITKLTRIGYTIPENENPEGRLATAEEIETTVDDFISTRNI
jgi:hypothetical protein